MGKGGWCRVYEIWRGVIRDDGVLGGGGRAVFGVGRWWCGWIRGLFVGGGGLGGLAQGS